MQAMSTSWQTCSPQRGRSPTGARSQAYCSEHSRTFWSGGDQSEVPLARGFGPAAERTF